MRDVYYESDLAGTLTEISPSVHEVLRRDRDDVIGACLPELARDPARAESLRQAQRMESSGTHEPGEAHQEPGHQVCFEVRDTGIGIPLEVRETIFEPFFTTKEKGRGIGLGLVTVYGIVGQGGGPVSVESTPGRGSTFRLLLPAVAEPTEAAESRSIFWSATCSCPA